MFLIMAETDVRKLVLGGKQFVSEQEKVQDIIPQTQLEEDAFSCASWD